MRNSEFKIYSAERSVVSTFGSSHFHSMQYQSLCVLVLLLIFPTVFFFSIVVLLPVVHSLPGLLFLSTSIFCPRGNVLDPDRHLSGTLTANSWQSYFSPSTSFTLISLTHDLVYSCPFPPQLSHNQCPRGWQKTQRQVVGTSSFWNHRTEVSVSQVLHFSCTLDGRHGETRTIDERAHLTKNRQTYRVTPIKRGRWGTITRAEFEILLQRTDILWLWFAVFENWERMVNNWFN